MRHRRDAPKPQYPFQGKGVLTKREVYEQSFKKVVELCKEAGLVEDNKVYYLDATLLKANGSLDSLEECGRVQTLKYTPEQYLDQVWAENGQNDEQSSQDEPGGGKGDPEKSGLREEAPPPEGKVETED